MSQEGLSTNSHTHPPSAHYCLGSMAQWPRGRPGAGHLGSNTAMATFWPSVSGKFNFSVPRFPSLYTGETTIIGGREGFPRGMRNF